MESISKKNGKKFTGKFAALAIRLGLAYPAEDEQERLDAEAAAKAAEEAERLAKEEAERIAAEQEAEKKNKGGRPRIKKP